MNHSGEGRWVRVWLMLLMASVLAFFRLPGVWAAAPEFRGMWVTRFDWASPNEATAKGTIDDAMTKLRQHRFNAVLFQVRGQADTLYPSPNEPWSPLISPGGEDPGWDPMAYALAAAHAADLEFHAYINTHTCWHNQSYQAPTDLNHLYWQHCNAANSRRRDWLVHNSSGQPVQYASDSYVWMAPGVPAAQAYTRKQVMYVVTQYDVDGVHFDRIRTPSAAYSYDPISLSRLSGDGNPHGLGFADWTRDQFTRMLCDLYAQIMEVKPHIKVSSAPLGLYRADRYAGYPLGYQYGYTTAYQDAQAWLAAGAMDFIVPMIYWADGGSLPDYSDILPDWVAHRAGRHVYGGQNRSVGVDELVQQVQVTRTLVAQGNVLFSYSGFNAGGFWPYYSASGSVYADSAAVPDMPWKQSPATGIIIGHVTDPNGDPVVDAQVTRTGSSYVGLSSGDGLYSFLNVPPGTYSLAFLAPGWGTGSLAGVTVAAGEVKRANITLGLDPQPPIITANPAAQDVCPGLSAAFAVKAIGQGTLSYRWQRDGVDVVDGGGVSGSRTRQLGITAAGQAQAGEYRCVVENHVGGVVSAGAGLTIKALTGFDSQPRSVSVDVGGTATFQVGLLGAEPRSYQWQHNGANVVNNERISGANSATLRIADVCAEDQGSYACIVSTACDGSISQSASLTVLGLPRLVQADFDGDGDVDLDEFAFVQLCLSGAGVPVPGYWCDMADLDRDGDVDQVDVAEMRSCLSGEGIEATYECGGPAAEDASTP